MPLVSEIFETYLYFFKGLWMFGSRKKNDILVLRRQTWSLVSYSTLMAGFSSEWIKTFPVHSGSGMEQVGNNT